MHWAFIFLSAALLVVACASKPTEDLVLADVALKAAQKVKADALAPDLFRRAENNYLRAKKDYADGYFSSCRTYSNDARMLAEQAEYHALLKQSLTKDKMPVDDSSGGSSAPDHSAESIPGSGQLQ